MLKTTVLALIIYLSAIALADPVTYELQPYTAPGYSANWVHDADACQSGALFMCGDVYELTGSFSGDLDGGILSDITGEFFVQGIGAVEILAGTIGGAFDWYLETDLGVFYFEDLGMGSGLPNVFDGQSLVLWGQNDAAYCAGGASGHCQIGSQGGEERYGIDIHAVSVPEPGTLGVLMLGMAGIAGIRKRKNNSELCA